MRRWLRQFRGHFWLIKAIGPINGVQYLAAQKEREKEKIEGFDPATHAERMLRAYGRLDLLPEAQRRGFC